MTLDTPESLIAALKQGEMIVLMDDEDRENEGDLVIAADCVNPAAINFMITHARGLVCLALSEAICQRLQLPLMVPHARAAQGTNFTLSIEARSGVTTGISAADRAQTIRVACRPDAHPEDLVQPGHVFPIMARIGGVLTRAGHTEAAVDLARLAGFSAAGVIVEIINPDGAMARRPELEKFAHKHQLKIGTIADLIAYRCQHEQTVKRTAEPTMVQTPWGEWRMILYEDLFSEQHLALLRGQPDGGVSMVRVHQLEPLRDLLNLTQPRWNFQSAMQQLQDHEPAVMVLLAAERHQPLLRQTSLTRTPGASGHYLTIGIGAQILRDIGVQRMRLLSHPTAFTALSGFGLEIEAFIPPSQHK